MISVAKEQRVRFLFKGGLSNRAIARVTGVSRKTVGAIRKEPELRKRPLREFGESKKLRRPYRCKTCGAKIRTYPCVICNLEGSYDNKSKVTPKLHSQQVSRVLTLDLLRIAEDIRNLHKLNLVHHPLFHNLAERAEQSLGQYQL